MESGGNFAQLLAAAQRRLSAYRLYLDLGAEDPAASAEVLIGMRNPEAVGRRARYSPKTLGVSDGPDPVSLYAEGIRRVWAVAHRKCVL